MKFPLSWLQDYVDISDLTPVQLADRLTRSGLEVEALIPVGHALCHVVTGRIDSIEKHPNADRLQVTQVNDGTTTHQIVTGAQNIAVGDIVPVSLPGAILANGLRIKPSQLRGVPSNGMLCSEAELGVADTANGIWILPPDTPLGVDFVSYGVLKETVLDIAILPNRGDCQSIFGLAREIAAVLDRPLRRPNTTVDETLPKPDLTLRIGDSSICPSYTVRTIQTIGVETPFLMKRRLTLCGIRPIRLAIDITNYVLLEMGQPLHAFDAGHIVDELAVSFATNQDVVTLLNHDVKPLSENIPVIRDANGVVAIAGVMGGLASSVTNETDVVLLEAGFFNPTVIRRAQVNLGLRSDSGARFEKGVDLAAIVDASNRAAHLFQSIAGSLVSPVVCVESLNHPLRQDKVIPWNPDQINGLLGTQYSPLGMANTLRRLGFGVNETGVHVPSWRRHDITDWPCLAEEIARIHGYDPIPADLSSRMVPQTPDSRLRKLANATDSYFLENGFQQVQTYTMVGPEDFTSTRLPLPSEWMHIKNPLTPSESLLRRHVMPSLLKVLSHNKKRQVEDLMIFEVGKVFDVDSSGHIREHVVAGALITGRRWFRPFAATEIATASPHFLHLKGIVDELICRFRVAPPVVVPTTYPQYHPMLAADLQIGQRVIGSVGFLHPEVLGSYDLDEPVGYIGLNLTEIATLPVDAQRFRPLSRFPSSRRDIAFLSPKSLGFDVIQRAIESARPSLLVDYYLFDHFESEKLGDGVQSLAIAFVYQSSDRTLSDDDVATAHQAMVEVLSGCLPITIR